MKKFFFMGIIIVLLLFTFSISAYAIDYSDVSNIQYEEIYNILAAYNIIQGYPDGSFMPGNCVTRAEMAKLATMLMGYENFTSDMISEYSDMKGHWAEGYSEFVSAIGIMNGFDDNTFRPEENVSFDEAVQIILRILGYKNELASSDYMVLARNLGLLNNINNPSTYVTRESISLIMYNALDCNIVSNINSTKKLLSNLGRRELTYINDEFTIKNLNIDKSICTDISNYMYSTLNVYYDINDKIVYIEKPNVTVIEGEAISASSQGVIFLRDEYGNPRLYNLNGIPIIFNGKRSYVDVSELKGSYVKLVISNNENKLLCAIVKKVTDVKIIDFNDLYKEGSYRFAGKYLPMLKNEVLYDKIIITGIVSNLNDIKENDVVYFYETKEVVTSKSILTIEVVRNKVTGIFTSRNYRNFNYYYNIASKEYKSTPASIIAEIPSGLDTVTAILDKDNTILKLDITKYGKSPETYAKVLDITSNNTTTLPSVSIVNQYGKVKTYTLKENCNVVTKTAIDGKIIYSTNLSKNSYIKYDELNSDTIKIVEPVKTVTIASNYNTSTGLIEKSYCKINNYTYIIQENDGLYKRIYSSNVNDYIEGTAIVNSNGAVSFLILTKNVKAEIPPTPTTPVDNGNTGNTGKPEIPNPTPSKGFTGTLYGVVDTISSGDKSYITLFNYSNKLYVQNSTLSLITGYKNRLIMLSVDDNNVKGLSSFSPEISNSKVTAVYKGLLQIDNLSYVEYSSNVQVFICTKDANGNVSSFKNASVSDIKINSVVQLYNTKKSSNGVFDVIVIMK